MKDKLTVSLVQTALLWEERTANLSHIEGLLRQVPSSTDLVVLPEMFTTGFSMNAAALAEPQDGPTLAWMCRWAAQIDSVLTGSLIVRREDGQFVNRLLWVSPDGRCTAYDKRYLFTLAGEDQTYAPGEERVLVDVRGWKVLPLICYDLRFPEWARNTMSYDLLLYVANWPAMRRRAWQTLLAARAIENQAYTIGVNRVGTDGKDLPYSGDSGVYDYTGEALLSAAHTEGVFTAVLDRKKQRSFREKFPFLRDQVIG